MTYHEWLQLLTTFGVGFFLGLKHALDADHVAAISAIVSETKSVRKSAFAGAIWGMGHTTALFAAGFVLLAFRLTIPEKLALSFEFLVGGVLIILGINVIRKMREETIHFHTHEHDNNVHAHFHGHQYSPSHYHAHRSFFIGIFHGLAGSAVLTLLVVATVPTLLQGLIFVLVFGAGSVIGMLMISAAIAVPFLATSRFKNLNRFVKLSTGIANLFLGAMLIYETGKKLLF